MRVPYRTNMPSTATVNNQGIGVEAGGRSAPSVRDVVVTLTLKVVGTVELSGSVLGIEQVAPVGAPVQLNEAVPLIPAPPIEKA